MFKGRRDVETLLVGIIEQVGDAVVVLKDDGDRQAGLIERVELAPRQGLADVIAVTAGIVTDDGLISRPLDGIRAFPDRPVAIQDARAAAHVVSP